MVKVQKKELEQKNLISRGKASKASAMDKAIKDEHNNVKKCKYVKKHLGFQSTTSHIGRAHRVGNVWGMCGECVGNVGGMWGVL